MNDAFTVGPFVARYSELLVLVVAVGSGLVAKRIGKTYGVDIEPVLWRSFLVGIVVSRLGLVYEFVTLTGTSCRSIARSKKLRAAATSH